MSTSDDTHARFFAAHPRAEGVEPDVEMTFEKILDSYKLAQHDGLEPMLLKLGVNQTHDIMKDSNFNRASSVGNTSGSLGVIAGVDVESEPANDAAILVAESEGECAYYIV